MVSTTQDVVDIRTADMSDIPVISTLAHAVWPEAYGSILEEAQLKHMLDLMYSHESLIDQFEKGHVFLIALMNAETVAFASYAHGPKAGSYRVHKLYVHPLLQGKGFGRRLLERIISNVKPSGATSILLNVNRHNPALKFYESLDFRIVGEEDIPIGEGYLMNDYVMEKAV